jgi:hypothetical protein
MRSANAVLPLSRSRLGLAGLWESYQIYSVDLQRVPGVEMFWTRGAASSGRVLRKYFNNHGIGQCTLVIRNYVDIWKSFPAMLVPRMSAETTIVIVKYFSCPN